LRSIAKAIRGVGLEPSCAEHLKAFRFCDPQVIEAAPLTQGHESHATGASLDAWQVQAAPAATRQLDEWCSVELFTQGGVKRDALPGSQMENVVGMPGNEGGGTCAL